VARTPRGEARREYDAEASTRFWCHQLNWFINVRGPLLPYPAVMVFPGQTMHNLLSRPKYEYTKEAVNRNMLKR
jgi:hypothetical protein